MPTPPQTTPRRLAELDLLHQIRLRATVNSSALRLGIGDDCALLRPKPGEEIAVTTDLSIDGRHFRLDLHPPESVGHRALARGLSDLAAMGARPLAAFVSIGLPRSLAEPPTKKSSQPSWVTRFYDGLLALALAHKTPLAGGDLSESPLALADIVLIGAVPPGRALLRSGARPGDLIYVTGLPGGAAAGLHKLLSLSTSQSSQVRSLRIPLSLEPLLRPHLYPQPRLAQGQWLLRHRSASAAIDISDGLSTDLAHLCEESGIAAEIDASTLPIAPGATLDQALHGGEDYELLFTAPPTAKLPRSIAGIPITRIGRTLRRRPRQPLILLRTPNSLDPLEPRGWQHFSST